MPRLEIELFRAGDGRVAVDGERTRGDRDRAVVGDGAASIRDAVKRQRRHKLSTVIAPLMLAPPSIVTGPVTSIVPLVLVIVPPSMVTPDRLRPLAPTAIVPVVLVIVPPSNRDAVKRQRRIDVDRDRATDAGAAVNRDRASDVDRAAGVA